MNNTNRVYKDCVFVYFKFFLPGSEFYGECKITSFFINYNLNFKKIYDKHWIINQIDCNHLHMCSKGLITIVELSFRLQILTQISM